MKPVTVLVIGAGSRGFVYARYSENNNSMKITGVAEPRKEFREQFAGQFNVDRKNVFTGWEEALEAPKMADAVIIATPDRMHMEPVVAALARGYHVLVEKPMAPTAQECRRMAGAAEKKILAVCHVLRYTPFFGKLKKLLDSGSIGDIVTIEHMEPVGYWHIAHSFVRGNWRNEAESSPMILAKSCHDLDILRWLTGAPCEKVASFGSLKHFKKENAPKGSKDRCIKGCKVEKECPYSALKLYLNTENTGWPVDVISSDPSRKARVAALKTGPYGRCVYKCDNDVVDHQVVILQFRGGITAGFTMSGFTKSIGARKIKIMGTMGELEGDSRYIHYHNFRNGQTTSIDTLEAGMGGHFGGDSGLVRDFIKAVQNNNPAHLSSSAAASLESHLMAFAAEKSRKTGEVVSLF